MSLFTVTLNTDVQGTLDKTYETGAGVQAVPSLQRTIFVTGPNGVHRKLKDGDTFTDCNYYKRFCPYDATTNSSGCDPKDAILVITTDDGSVWSNVAAENTFLKVYNLTAEQGDTYTDTNCYADIAGDFGSYANFCQIQNTQSSGGSASINVKINGSANAIFTLAAGQTQYFNPGDVQVTAVAIDNSSSGNATAYIEVICGIKSVAQS